jgi:hypothetical protein
MTQANTMLPLFSENGVLQNQIMVVVPDIKVCSVITCNKYNFLYFYAVGYELS